MKKQSRLLLPLVLLFILVNTFLLTGTGFLIKHGIDGEVVLIANVLLFTANIVAFFIQRRGLQNKNPNVFVRSMMGGMMIKMLLLLGAFIIYVIALGKQVNKPALYIALFLYVLYLVIEVSIVMKLNRQKHA
ncbi:MAG: hypothetical protein JST86_11585 [Bacteroidetes bacterium]|nr:hypothetical protein [Bacteroidota bacterium]